MTEILDEGAVSEALERHAKAEQIVDDFYSTEFALAASLNDIPPLCATVKHLRAENELWSMWHVKEPGPCGHHPCQLYDLRKVTNNPDAAHGCVACEVTALQSQLEQLRAENETLRSRVLELETEIDTKRGYL